MHSLRIRFNRHFLLHRHLQHGHLDQIQQLQSLLGYQYVLLALPTTFRKWRRHLMPPALPATPEHAEVYLYLRFDGRHQFYIGQTTQPTKRKHQHRLSTKQCLWDTPGADRYEDLFHRQMAAIGPGSFIYLRLQSFGSLTTWNGAESLLKASLRHAERYFISLYARFHPSTLNTADT